MLHLLQKISTITLMYDETYIHESEGGGSFQKNFNENWMTTLIIKGKGRKYWFKNQLLNHTLLC